MQKFKDHHDLFNTCGQHLVTVGGATITLDELFMHFEARLQRNTAERIAEVLVEGDFTLREEN